MTEFQFSCPKCGSTSSFGITSLNNVSYAEKGAWADRVFACMCGKRLYGEAIREEYDRQLSFAEDRAKEQAAEERRKKREEAKRREEERRREEEERAAREAKVVSLRPKASPCAWRECSNSSRENSKYCSLDCKNKNARYRYKLRKAGG